MSFLVFYCGWCNGDSLGCNKEELQGACVANPPKIFMGNPREKQFQNNEFIEFFDCYPKLSHSLFVVFMIKSEKKPTHFCQLGKIFFGLVWNPYQMVGLPFCTNYDKIFVNFCRVEKKLWEKSLFKLDVIQTISL